MRDFGFQWHLTDRCNLRCSHCYQDRFDGSSELSTAELLRLADRVLGGVAGRPTTINLTGGEPLLHPGLLDLVQHLDSFEDVVEINLITNGTKAPDGLLEQIGAVKTPGLFKVSLESTSPAVNDAVRGAGSFDRVLANLHRFAATGRSVVLMMTLTKSNAAEVIDMVYWARELGLAGVIFERFVPLGRGLSRVDEVLDATTWRAVVRDLTSLAGVEEDDLDNLLPYEAFWVVFGPQDDLELRGAACNLGDESMALMPNGTVLPCRRLPISIGKATVVPFERILEDLARWAPEVTRLRLTGPTCSRCDVSACAGCRALALALRSDPFADDLLCPLSAGLTQRPVASSSNMP